MEWLTSWIQGIIIAVIISTIIEMILPEGTSKKYIKVVIGVYILFSIVSPVITKFTGSSFSVSNIFDLDEYIETSTSNTLQSQLTEQSESQIKEIYVSSIKSDIKEKIQNKGYTVNSVEVEVEDNEEYTLKQIRLQVYKASSDESSTETVQIVNEVKITIGNVQNAETSDEAEISSGDKKELKEYLSGVYEINTKNIFINE